VGRRAAGKTKGVGEQSPPGELMNRGDGGLSGIPSLLTAKVFWGVPDLGVP